nr:immunoglobulin heavy chain junction region [Macaca mulatta]MOW86790.1 immunoglobulin heavy chain junction region [Macaca mulatta]MOW86841.1 immunoglobulin heavy chain junction region [Macaca mulatta]MOW87055.1 immunoglobulin heavy chain junction region [Macaca mulatta]MOW87058.1 immunoglobulin heavy chain junction region [Macaca mulatta]
CTTPGGEDDDGFSYTSTYW